MKRLLFVEGGGPSAVTARCREGFDKLLQKTLSLVGRNPKIIPCGSRNDTFDSFCTAHLNKAEDDVVLMLVDSEDPMGDIESAWDHLKNRDGWDRPEGAEDEQVLLMATCMETWIVADRDALKSHYGSKLQESALPSLHGVEGRGRGAILGLVQKRVTHGRRKASAPGSRISGVVKDACRRAPLSAPGWHSRRGNRVSGGWEGGVR